MTTTTIAREILLTTPRGKTAVVSVEELQEATNNVAIAFLQSGNMNSSSAAAANSNKNDATPTTTSTTIKFLQQQALLQQLIDASKRRDIGRKRTIQDAGHEQEHEHHHQNQRCCQYSKKIDQQQYENFDCYDYDELDCCYDDDDNLIALEGIVEEEDDVEMETSDEEEDAAAEEGELETETEHECSETDDEDGVFVVPPSTVRMMAGGDDDEVVVAASKLQLNFKSLSLDQHQNQNNSNSNIPRPSHFPSQLSTTTTTTTTMTTNNPRRQPSFTIYHQGRQLSLETLWKWIQETNYNCDDNDQQDDIDDDNLMMMALDDRSSLSSPSSFRKGHLSETTVEPTTATTPKKRCEFPLYLTLNPTIRVLGGIDRQNRVGSKFGGGGVSSSQQSERERKERLKQLALESIDLAKDPYLMRNHLGTYECKLCLTLHTNEANYLAHTQGKKHQQNLAKRAHLEKQRQERLAEQEAAAGGSGLKRPPASDGTADTAAAAGAMSSQPTKMLKIGRPAYQVYKSRDPDTNQRCLTFELMFPQITDGLQPRHRFVSAFEQKVELPDRRYQYLLLAAQPYETVAFKIPNEPLDVEPGRFITHWDTDDKRFTLTLYFQEQQQKEEDDVGGGSGGKTNDTAAVAAAS